MLETFTMGYRSMCRWYSGRVFDALESMGYEWVLRIDDDSGFPEPVYYNIVQELEAGGFEYGYRNFGGPDAEEVTRGLAEASAFWMVTQSIKPTWLLQFFCHGDGPINSACWDRNTISTNFFASKVKLFVRPDVVAFRRWLEAQDGFYRFRWGDAPVHTLILGMFEPRNNVAELGFSYKHKEQYEYGMFGINYNYTNATMPRIHGYDSGPVHRDRSWFARLSSG